MSKTNTAEALQPLQTAYTRDFSELTYELYTRMLSDIHPITLRQAVVNHINESRWLPTVAELRERAKAISNYVNAVEAPLSAEEAWGKVMIAAQSYGCDKGLEQLEPLSKRLMRGVWIQFCYSDKGDMIGYKAHFIKAYEQERKREASNTGLAASIVNNPILLAARKEAEAKRLEIKAKDKPQALPAGEQSAPVEHVHNPFKLLADSKMPHAMKAILNDMIPEEFRDEYKKCKSKDKN